MASSAAKLRNIGPKSAAWLRQVGVRTQEDLEKLGAVEAYIRVKRAGFRPSLNLLYALEGALLDCHWQEVPEDRRGELVLAADAASALLPLPRGKRTGPVGPVTTTTYANSEDSEAAPEPDFGFDDPAAEAESRD